MIHQNTLQWKGFLQQMTCESGMLFPCSLPIALEKDWETRARAVDVGGSALIVGGYGRCNPGFRGLYFDLSAAITRRDCRSGFTSRTPCRKTGCFAPDYKFNVESTGVLFRAGFKIPRSPA